MAFVTPTNVTVGSVLTASKYNQEAVENVGVIRAAQINVQSVTKTDKYSQSTASRVFTSNVTGLDVTITPSSSTSKILLICSLSIASGTGAIVGARLLRGVTAIAVGDAEGSRARVSAAQNTAVVTAGQSVVITTLDTPNTTSATTYGVQLYNNAGSTQTLFLNQGTDTAQNDGGILRTASSITAIEVPV